MSVPDPPSSGDLVTCPRCRLSFPPGAGSDGDATPPGSGTVTVLPPSPTPTVPAPNQDVPARIDRFAITRYLGEGAFGRVYLAHDPLLKRDVALKVAKPEQMAGQKRVERFQREARAAANLLHPHIVAVFDSGQDGPHHNIASAFVPGRSLATVLEETASAGKRLELREAVALVRKLAEALAYAHKQGVVHRDVKPGNVMLRDDGEPLLMDFGLAARADETEKLSVAGQFMGTPEYSAPEQWRGQAQAASDQYSLGCLFFEVLTGEKPFVGASSEHYLMLHTQVAPPAPRNYRVDLPHDLETICLKCLEKEPERRYADCQALADDLRRFLEGEPVTARRPGMAERLVRWTRRNPAVAALTAAVAVSLLLGAGSASLLAFHAYRQARRADDETVRAEKEAQAATEMAEQQKKLREEAVKSEKAANMARHGFQMTAAWQAWQQNDVAAVNAYLAEVPPALQLTWEYRHLQTLARRKVLSLQGHANIVYSVAFGPDGKRIISGSDDQTVKVWDAATGQELLTLKGHVKSVNSVAISTDGKRIISGSDDQTVKVWDAGTGQNLLTLEGHKNRVLSVAISADGKRIVSGSSDMFVIVWNTDKEKVPLTLKGHTGAVTGVVFSPDGKRIVSASEDHTLKVWDSSTGQPLLPPLSGHAKSVNCVAFSPDGKRIVSGSDDNTVMAWDSGTGQHLLTLRGHTDHVMSVAISPDAQRILSGSRDQTVKVWDAATGQDLLTLKGHSNLVTSVVYSPDGNRIASGSWDNAVKMWDAGTGQDLLTLAGHGSRVLGVVISPDGQRIVSGSHDRTLKVWDAATGQILLTLKGHTSPVNSVAISADGKHIVSGSMDGTVKIWDSETGRMAATLTGHARSVTSVAISPLGNRIVSGSEDRTVKVWDSGTGHELLTLKGHTDQVTSVAISPGGQRIVSGSWDNTVRVWDADTGQELLTLKGDSKVFSVAISADGKRILGGSRDRTVKVWDAGTGQDLLTLKGHTGPVNSVAISADGNRIISGSRDQTVKVWDAGTGQDLLTLKGHTGPVNCVWIGTDGKRIISGSEDKTVKVWDRGAGRNLLTLKGHTENILSVAFSLDGKHIFGRDASGDVHAWDVETGAAAPSARAAMPAGSTSVAVLGNRRAFVDEQLIRLERILSREEQWQRRMREEPIERFLRLRAGREYHAAEAETAEQNHQPFAAVFHLDRLLPLLPQQRAQLLARRRAVLTTALKKAPGDRWAARALARQAIGDPDSLSGQAMLRSLRDVLERQTGSSHDRLYGALLLRTGSPRESILVLGAAITRRGSGGPPVEELLLALAHLQHHQPAEASKHLQTSLAWMRAGTTPVRAAVLAGLATAGSLSTLSALTITPPDPRLESLDPATAHEVIALRAEVEKALATAKP